MDPTSKSDLLLPPPQAFTLPGFAAIALGVILTGALLLFAMRLDHTKGALTVSLLVILGFMAALTWAVRYNIPQDPETAALVGGLVAAFGAVVAYWIGGGGHPK